MQSRKYNAISSRLGGHVRYKTKLFTKYIIIKHAQAEFCVASCALFQHWPFLQKQQEREILSLLWPQDLPVRHDAISGSWLAWDWFLEVQLNENATTLRHLPHPVMESPFAGKSFCHYRWCNVTTDRQSHDSSKSTNIQTDKQIHKRYRYYSPAMWSIKISTSILLSPPVHIAQWAHMHCFLSVVCLDLTKNQTRK